MDCDPSNLANAARCFFRCDPIGSIQPIKTYLLCRLASHGLSSCPTLSTPDLVFASSPSAGQALVLWADPSAVGNAAQVPTFTIKYGTTNGGPYTSTLVVPNVGGGLGYSQAINGLTTGITYYFVIIANGAAGCPDSAQSAQTSALIINGLLNNLIAYWKNDEVGGPARVSQVNAPGANLTADAGVTNIVGLINNGSSSGGGAAAMHNPSATFKISPGESFTVSLWLQMKSFIAGFRGVFAQWDGGTAIEYFLWFPNNTNLTWQVNNAANSAMQTMVIAGPPTLNVWHHVVVGYDDATQAAFYQYDNAPRVNGAIAGVFKNGGANLYVMAYLGGTGPIDAWVDENGFWKRVLTTAEVNILYNGGAGFPFGSFTA